MENTPPEYRIWFRMNFASGVFSSRTLVSVCHIKQLTTKYPERS